MYEVAKRSIALAGAIVLATAASVAAAEPVGPKLTPKLRDALRQEMASVLLASQDIVGALAIGDHATVAERAQQIHDSFILEQSLTEQDRQDLEAALPPEVVELDRGFHETSAALAAAARTEDVEQELSAFARMTDACVTCHGRFAADRFPSLARE
jgi:cytochrome c556